MRITISRLLAFFPISLFIFSVSPSFGQTINMVAGNMKVSCAAAPCGDGGLAISASLYTPSGMVIDANNNIYIAEFSNHAIRKIDAATGIISTVAGTQRSACGAAPCGDGGLATSALLNGPRGVGVDSDGNIYVADFSDHAIRKVDITTGIITTVAGTLRSSCASGTCGDGGLATDALLNSPNSVRFDAAGNMYIADYGNHVVRKVDKITGIITTVAGTMKSSCSTAPCGDGGLATSANLNGPSGIALSTDGKLYIVEYGNHAVRMVNLGTGIISTAAGTQRSSCTTSPCGDGGIATSARLSSPFGLTLDHNNNIFIADASNAAIRKVDVTTGLISTVAGIIRSSCSVVPCGNGGDATSAQLSNPFGVAFNSVGDLFIVEYSNQAVRKVSMGVLPVTMSQILAYANNGVANLQWKALNQSGVARYEIERSADGYTFKKAGELAAKSEGLMELNYWWADPSPDFGYNFYRIKSIDLDGSYGYSETVKVNVNQKPGEIRVFPNPVTDGIMQLQINSSQLNNWEVALFDTRGQKIHAQQFTTQPGMLTKEIKLPSKIPAGTYFLHIISGNRTLRVEKVFLKNNQ